MINRINEIFYFILTRNKKNYLIMKIKIFISFIYLKENLIQNSLNYFFRFLKIFIYFIRLLLIYSRKIYFKKEIQYFLNDLIVIAYFFNLKNQYLIFQKIM